MSTKDLTKDSRVVYYAEGEPYKGPFPALVNVVHAGEKGEDPKLDLRVFFNGIDGVATQKTGVPFSFEPKKHHWSNLPADWPWPQAAPEPEPAASE